jgi:hypothetical protein
MLTSLFIAVHSIVRDGLVRSGKTVVGVLTFMNCMVKGREDGWLKVLVSDDEKVEPHLAKYYHKRSLRSWYLLNINN